jgi:hypothetical protein
MGSLLFLPCAGVVPCTRRSLNVSSKVTLMCACNDAYVPMGCRTERRRPLQELVAMAHVGNMTSS